MKTFDPTPDAQQFRQVISKNVSMPVIQKANKLSMSPIRSKDNMTLKTSLKTQTNQNKNQSNRDTLG